MKHPIFFFFFILSCCAHALYGQQQLSLTKDLRNEWLIYNGSDYVPYKGESTNILYLRLNTFNYPQEYIRIESPDAVDLFVNGQVVGSGSSFQLSLDSLAREFAASQLLIGVYQKGIHDRKVAAHLFSTKPPASLVDTLVKREQSSFRDFAILAGLFLITMIVFLLRLNPKLAADYLSIPKVFSRREGDDAHLYSRIANSTNILFYVFSALLISYYIIIIFHFVEARFAVALWFDASSFSGIFKQWFILSFFILNFWIVKLTLVFLMSYVFGIPEIPGIHYFNWTRLIVLMFGSLTIFLFIYFIWHGQKLENYVIFYKLIAWVLGGWMILIFFKLVGMAKSSMFHLFSYLCATELIPFLIILKVLYT